jgi:hypothetical protein
MKAKFTTVLARDRQDAAMYLRLKLGSGYSWSPLLAMWATADCVDGLRGNPEVRCEPSFLGDGKPKYLPADLEQFVLQVREFAPDLAPAPFALQSYEFDGDFPARLPWRLRRARSCTKTPAPPTAKGH